MTTLKTVLPFLIWGVTRAAVQCGDVVCFHNSRCVAGAPDFSDQPLGLDGQSLDIHDTSGVSMHCQCNPFYTGIDCSVPVDNCDDGVHRCFHGGICKMDSPDELPYCDCTNAVDLATEKQYVGQYCEQAAPEKEDDYCSKVDARTFCLNGGTCNPEFPENSSDPCNCLIDFKGTHCELPNENTARDCTLECQNGGLCRLGEDPDPSQTQNHFDINTSDKMRCECPHGFSGELCQNSTSACGGIECLNGGTCKLAADETGREEAYCDCKSSYDDENQQFFAGQYCQYPSTQPCGSSAQGQVLFCTNGGTCNQDFPAAGCVCPQGALGLKCEYLQEKDCSLECINGKCTVGEPPEDTSSFEIYLSAKDHHNFQYCSCDTGFSGRLCEIEADNACDDFACLNGGQCVVDEVDGETTYSCNCLSASDDVNGIYWDGRFCQFTSTSVCFDDVENNEIYFCMNNGQCNTDYTKGCHCPEGFGGFSCEFVEGKDCTLGCQNSGKCVLGSPPEESYIHAYWFNADDYKNWQYCDCPPEYSGALCEAKVQDCGDFQCLNGGSCFDEDGVTPMEGRCNCLGAYDPIGDGIYYDGKFCQFASTSVCFEGVVDGESQSFFCMNDGECQEDYLKGCVCPEGYAGFSCEFLEAVDCNEDCGEHGTCRLGAPPSGSHAHAYWFDPEAQADYEYCECDKGWGGKYCDVQGDDCGDFTCLNGGSCYDKHGKAMVDRCNCLKAEEDNGLGETTYYDGRFCQYASTVTCFDGQVDGDDQVFFCMNGGKCREDYLKGCDCPDGFDGFSCEFIKGTDCTLDCGDDGECRLGSPPGSSHAHAYWFDPDAQDDFQYCECKNGAGGKFCDVKGEDCGLFTCLNGGSCFGEDGVTPVEDRCNCIPAWEEGNPNVYYDGRYCQYASTSVCLEADHQSFFCMNNGECSDDPANVGCTCPEGFAGYYCEFIEGTDCNLECQNGGTCRLGAPPGGSHAHAYWYDPLEQENYQYCECAAGFGGKYCEFAGEDCGDFTCLNGGKCDSTLPDRCNCLEAFDDGEGSIPTTFYDGRFCQYASTSVCKEDVENSEDYFCMNDGQCRRDVTQGCDCPDGFAGFSCEFIEGTDCTLDCGRGTCKLGTPPDTDYLHAYWYAPDAQGDYEYCECPSGTNGKSCEATAIDCGEYTCLNGGQCKSEEGRVMNGRCNCIEALDPVTDTFYDGLYCQYPSTTVCYEDEDEAYFCANNGRCNDADFTLGCDCDPGFAGFYCEFKDPDDCTLDCQNGGTCVLGAPPGTSVDDAYWYNPETEDHYQYCRCPAGFSGPLCETLGDKKCGDSECFNGGTCITRTVDGREVHHCDCRDAAGDGKYYAGTYCQYASTDVCEVRESSAFFCVNQGECQEDYRRGCRCPEDTRGFSCEFVLNENVDTSNAPEAPSSTIVDEVGDAECELECNGNGTCRNGIKDISDLGDAGNANHLSYTHDDFKHCVCNEGWTGLYCDHKIAECEDSDHFCLHGSECVEESTGLCDCSKADSDIAENFAGEHCQHTADVCVTEDSNGSPRSYCANGGTCKSYTDRVGEQHPGCECLDGFTGDRCEFTIQKGPTKSTTEGSAATTSRSRRGDDGSLGGLGIAAIVLSVCAVMAVMMFTINSCVRRKRFSRQNSMGSSGIMWDKKGGYRDNSETINFSPKAGYRDDYMASFATPSRDPMATALAPDMSDPVDSDTSSGMMDTDNDETQVFIGPPTDEDGHVLHNVDIL